MYILRTVKEEHIISDDMNVCIIKRCDMLASILAQHAILVFQWNKRRETKHRCAGGSVET